MVELAAIEEDALAFGALVDDDAVALVLPHQTMTFRTEHFHAAKIPCPGPDPPTRGPERAAPGGNPATTDIGKKSD
ncbi:hypothetical protein GCM10027447_12950 [Glycomyces halotolerans]